MIPLDVKAIEKTAQEEIHKERMERATEKLKELYAKKEKALLVVRNIEREITSYLQEVGEMTVYESAGVDVSNKS